MQGSPKLLHGNVPTADAGDTHQKRGTDMTVVVDSEEGELREYILSILFPLKLPLRLWPNQVIRVSFDSICDYDEGIRVAMWVGGSNCAVELVRIMMKLEAIVVG